MTKPWREMQTGDLYKALLSKDPEVALKQLQATKRALRLTANRARIQAGHKLMNKFNQSLHHFIKGYQEDYGENYISALREFSAAEIIENIYDDDLDKLFKDYMEYCYD